MSLLKICLRMFLGFLCLSSCLGICFNLGFKRCRLRLRLQRLVRICLGFQFCLHGFGLSLLKFFIRLGQATLCLRLEACHTLNGLLFVFLQLFCYHAFLALGTFRSRAHRV